MSDKTFMKQLPLNLNRKVESSFSTFLYTLAHYNFDACYNIINIILLSFFV